MKKLIFALLMLCLVLVPFVGKVGAAEVNLTFAWEQTPSDLPQLAKWTLYYGTTSGGPYNNPIDIAYDGSSQGNFQSSEVIIAPDGTETTFYFVMTATDKNGNESKYSNEVFKVIDFAPPNAPFSLQVTVTTN